MIDVISSSFCCMTVVQKSWTFFNPSTYESTPKHHLPPPVRNIPLQQRPHNDAVSRNQEPRRGRVGWLIYGRPVLVVVEVKVPVEVVIVIIAGIEIGIGIGIRFENRTLSTKGLHVVGGSLGGWIVPYGKGGGGRGGGGGVVAAVTSLRTVVVVFRPGPSRNYWCRIHTGGFYCCRGGRWRRLTRALLCRCCWIAKFCAWNSGVNPRFDLLVLGMSNKEPTEGVSFALWSRGLDFFFLDLNVVLGRVGGPVVVCSEAGRASSKISFFMKLFRTASVAIWDH